MSAAPAGGALVFDDMEHGNPFGNGWFVFGGSVGGGGIGYILKPRVDLGEWGEVGTLVLLIAGTVWLMDIISAKIRERIV